MIDRGIALHKMIRTVTQVRMQASWGGVYSKASSGSAAANTNQAAEPPPPPTHTHTTATTAAAAVAAHTHHHPAQALGGEAYLNFMGNEVGTLFC